MAAFNRNRKREKELVGDIAVRARKMDLVFSGREKRNSYPAYMGFGNILTVDLRGRRLCGRAVRKQPRFYISIFFCWYRHFFYYSSASTPTDIFIRLATPWGIFRSFLGRFSRCGIISSMRIEAQSDFVVFYEFQMISYFFMIFCRISKKIILISYFEFFFKYLYFLSLICRERFWFS